MVDFANKLQDDTGLRPARGDRACRRHQASADPDDHRRHGRGHGAAPDRRAPAPRSRFDIGVVIAAGMTIGTLFTLFVTPAVYTFLAKTIRRRERGRLRARHRLSMSQFLPWPERMCLAKAADREAEAGELATLVREGRGLRKAIGRGARLQLGCGSGLAWAEKPPKGRGQPPEPKRSPLRLNSPVYSIPVSL